MVFVPGVNYVIPFGSILNIINQKFQMSQNQPHNNPTTGAIQLSQHFNVEGGVILGASIILFAISHDLRTALTRIREKLDAVMCATGVLIYVGTGALCLLLGLNFLDYSALASILGVDPITARSHGILIVEIGVGIAVMGTMIWIYSNVSSKGKYDEGL